MREVRYGNSPHCLRYGVFDEAAGSAVQLLINVCAIVLAGVLTLLVQRLWWHRVTARRPVLPARRMPAVLSPRTITRRPGPAPLADPSDAGAPVGTADAADPAASHP